MNINMSEGTWGFNPSDFIGFGVESVMSPVLDSRWINRNNIGHITVIGWVYLVPPMTMLN